MELFNLVEKYLLDENIPKDLLQAYMVSDRVGSPYVNPNSRHDELSNPSRRSVSYKYGSADYDVISPEQAIEYLRLEKKADGTWKCNNKDEFIKRLPSLRFLVSGKVLEWEVKASGTIYYTYWAYFPREKAITTEGEPFYFRGKSGPTLDTRFANKYTDIANIAFACDKIYKTNEYELEISPEEKHKRVEKSQRSTLKRFMSKNDPNWDPHNMFKNYGALEKERENPEGGVIPAKINTFKIQDTPDTGSHKSKDIQSRYSDMGIIDPSKYMDTLRLKKELLLAYNDVRNYLKKLDSEKDELDPDEYAQLSSYWKEKEKIVYTKYKEVLDVIRKIKDHTLDKIDKLTAELSEKKAKKLEEVQKVLDQAYKLSKTYDELKKKSDVWLDIADDSRPYSVKREKQVRDRKLRDLNTSIYNYIETLENEEQQLKEIESKVEGQQALELMDQTQGNDTEEIKDIIKNLEKVIDQGLEERDYIISIDTKEHLEKLKEFENTLKTLEDEIAKYKPIQAARKKAIKDAEAARDKRTTLDPTLQDIIQFVTD